MTEGISLFLSRDIPAVWLIRTDGTRVCVRETFETAVLTSQWPEYDPALDFAAEENLIGDHILSSLSILSLIAELEDEFDITIPAVEVIPANFNSAKAMWSMIQRLQEEE